MKAVGCISASPPSLSSLVLVVVVIGSGLHRRHLALSLSALGALPRALRSLSQAPRSLSRSALSFELGTLDQAF